MAWTTVAHPSLGSRRKRKKINLHDYGGTASWAGSLDRMNMLHNVYRGRFDRIERYKLWNRMDEDSDISRALDLIAEHTCERDDDTKDHFLFDWKVEDPTDEESVLLHEAMTHWRKINSWDNRLFRTMRNVLKYGDWFFFRNPDTFELYSLHPKFVMGALVDRDKLEVIGWIVRDFKFNIENIEMAVDDRALNSNIQGLNSNTGFRNTKVIPAIHIVHLSLSEGKFSGAASDDDPSDNFSNRWPFGESWLEQAYKTYKQRELLEDAALIHRVQRAPSRTIWYIDTGKMRADRATWTVRNFANEMNQKRIPTFIGTGMGDQKSIDSLYNPISQLEDYYVPLSADQKGSKVETLEGTPWDSMPDLDYFTKKIMRALRVPFNWMVGPQEGGSIFNDGRIGVAYQEEIEFSRFCSRVQENIDDEFDFEFKLYCKLRDINVNSSDYELKFFPPTNYAEYKDNAAAQDNINVWAAIKDVPYVSKRFSLEKYLKWTEEDITKNERMVVEEISKGLEGDLAQDDGMGGGGMGGAPMGALPPPGPGGEMGGLGLTPNSAGGTATGADMAGGNLAATAPGGGGGAFMGGGGGFGEGKMKKGSLLVEVTRGDIYQGRIRTRIVEDITTDDIKPAERKEADHDLKRTPKDALTMSSDRIKHQVITSLAMVRKIRLAHMARRVENQKRLKMIQKVYQQAAPDAMGGGAPPGM